MLTNLMIGAGKLWTKILRQGQQKLQAKNDGNLNNRKRPKLLDCKALFSLFAIMNRRPVLRVSFSESYHFFPRKLGFSPDGFLAEQIIKSLGCGKPWESRSHSKRSN